MPRALPPRALRDALITYTGAEVAVVIADSSDGRADRRGVTLISIGAAGRAPSG
ncbi:hypothetical protein AB0G85_37020 [Streptomyces sioyaensis]|uniref:hypothetical protein n=1 Tax=Streptomyces sioyaensis TaxID=67364 RepID=UPI003402E251